VDEIKITIVICISRPGKTAYALTKLTQWFQG